MTSRLLPRTPVHSLLIVALALGACASPSQPPTQPTPRDDEPEVCLPALGTDVTLDLGTWNVEWFGDVERGPSDEAVQLENVHRVLAGLDVDLWSVQEIGDAGHFAELLSRLDGYDGLLATDPVVEDGAEYYGDFGGTELKVGLLYRPEHFEVLGARVVLTERDHEFAGRPPVEVRLTARAEDASDELVVILIHAKAGAAPEDRDRRVAAAAALEAYLDATWPDAAVAVLGDFNDDVDTSITEGEPSSYANFVESPAYDFPTAALSYAGEKSTVYYPDVIDHHMVSDDLLPWYVEGSAVAYRPEPCVVDYGESTSDHYPVVTRWTFPGGVGGGGGAGLRPVPR